MDKLSGKIGSENLAYIMMTVATSVFALGFLYSNEHNFDVCETFLVRSISLIAINFAIARVYGMDLSYQDPYNFRILLARNFLVGIQNTMFTLAQFYLSQPIVQTMNTSSILFIFILDYFLNGVTLTKKQFYGVIFGILGVLLTVNGDLIISTINPGFERQSEFQNYATEDPKIKLLIASMFIGSNVLWAYAQVLTKKLTGVNPVQLNLHIGFVFIMFTGVSYPSMVEKQVEVWTFIKGILFGGIVSALSQIVYIGALKMTKKTGLVTTFSFSSVIVGYFVSVARYN